MKVPIVIICGFIFLDWLPHISFVQLNAGEVLPLTVGLVEGTTEGAPSLSLAGSLSVHA
jgi:hypothetical protein